MQAPRRRQGLLRHASKRSAAAGAIAFALAFPGIARADQQLAAAHPADGAAAPAAAAPAAPAHPAGTPAVSFDFLRAPAPVAPQDRHRTGLAGLADRVEATAHRLNDPHAQQRWGYSHGRVTFTFKTGGR